MGAGRCRFPRNPFMTHPEDSARPEFMNATRYYLYGVISLYSHCTISRGDLSDSQSPDQMCTMNARRPFVFRWQSLRSMSVTLLKQYVTVCQITGIVFVENGGSP